MSNASLNASYEFYFKHKWPRFSSHDEVSCFNCGGDFGPDPYWAESGLPHGHGQFRQECEKCRLATWYDLET